MNRTTISLMAVVMIAGLGCAGYKSDIAVGDAAEGFDHLNQQEVSTSETDGKQDAANPSQNQRNQESEMASHKTVRIGGIDWYQDYDVALQVAKKSNKPLWLHFGENPG